MKKQYLFLILVIYLIGCIMNLCYYIVIALFPDFIRIFIDWKKRINTR